MITEELTEQIKTEYKRILEELDMALSMCRKYDSLLSSLKRNPDNIYLKNTCDKIIIELKEICGEWIETNLLSCPLQEMDSDDLIHIEEASPNQIAKSIKEDIIFFERGLNYTHNKNHKNESELFEVDNEPNDFKNFSRTDYSNADLYAFKDGRFGVSHKPKFSFGSLTEAVDFFVEMGMTGDSKNPRGAIWKAIREVHKGRTAFGYRWSLNSNINSSINRL